MPKQGVEKLVLEELRARAEAHGIDIVDVEVTGATKAPCVRVRIDHADESLPTITLDEVTAESAWISEAIDELDPISSAFVLEVSSPGLDRPLSRPRDFERFAGQTVAVSLEPGEGRRRYTGTLLGIEGEHVALEVDGERVELALDDIKKCTIKPDYAALAKGEKNA